MGCASVRFSPLEQHINKHSVLTGFEKLHVERAVTVIRSHSTAKLILKSQFSAIERALRLNTSSSAQPVLATFYTCLAAGGDNLTARVLAASPRLTAEQIGGQTMLSEEDLLVTAILLGGGSPLDKAAALYHVFDEGFLNTLPASTLRDLFTLVFRIAIDDLPVLSSQRSEEDVQTYLRKAQTNSSRAVQTALEAILEKQSSLSLEEFAKRMGKYRGEELTCPEGIRAYAKNCLEKKTQEEEYSAE